MAANLERFISAQTGVFTIALAELEQGKKTSHWMWFIFPQLNGLALSATARRYAIQDLQEAIDYLQHPLLGTRLVRCAETLVNIEGRTAAEIFGFPDNLKLCSCLTLFEVAARHCGQSDEVFAQALAKYYQGKRDDKTLVLLGLSPID